MHVAVRIIIQGYLMTYMMTSYSMLLLRTPDKIFSKLDIDNQNMAKHHARYLDNTQIWVLSRKRDNTTIRKSDF